MPGKLVILARLLRPLFLFPPLVSVDSLRSRDWNRFHIVLLEKDGLRSVVFGFLKVAQPYANEPVALPWTQGLSFSQPQRDVRQLIGLNRRSSTVAAIRHQLRPHASSVRRPDASSSTESTRTILARTLRTESTRLTYRSATVLPAEQGCPGVFAATSSLV